MKLVREHINEKFIEKSDPVKDMGIGVEKYKKPQNDIDDFFNLVDEYMIELKKVKNWNKLKEDYFSYIKICGNEMRSPFDVGNKIFRDLKRRKLLEVNEKFTEKSDPVTDMGIGKINFKDEFHDQYFVAERKLYKKWQDFVNQFKGKWIIGKFHVYEHRGDYEGKIVHAEVKFTNIDMNNEGVLNLKTSDNRTYCMLDNEEYTIKD
jgi:hypothetical protein